MTLNKFSASRAERLEVGSSMMSTRALVERALAISTSCCWPMASVLTSVSGFTSSPTAALTCPFGESTCSCATDSSRMSDTVSRCTFPGATTDFVLVRSTSKFEVCSWRW